jgi:hypothetical protein
LSQFSHIHFSKVALHRFLDEHLIDPACFGALRLGQRCVGGQANGYDETVFDHRMHEFLLSMRLAAEQATESSVPSGQSMRGI